MREVQENCREDGLDVTRGAELEPAATFLVMLERKMPIYLSYYRTSVYLHPQIFRIPCSLKQSQGNSLAVQWLGCCAFTAEGPGSTPGQGTKTLQALWQNKNKNKNKQTKKREKQKNKKQSQEVE